MKKSKNEVYPLAMTAVMAAVMAVVGPFALPIGPVPISLCTLVIYLAAYVLGQWRGTVAVLVYLLLGVVGMPVFSGFSGGLGKVAGPTGGYLVGYLLLAAVSGWAAERFPQQRLLQLAGMVLGTVGLYAMGTAWFCVQSGSEVGAALTLCVVPFLPGDAVKMAVALTLGPSLRRRLEQAGLQSEP